MKTIKSCEFNMDTGCVELQFQDGSMISIDCTAVENEVADNRFQRSELDYLIYNDPLAYADHCGDLGGAVAVNRQDFAGDNDVVAQIGREEGTHGAVDQAGGQNCGQAGLTLAAHEAAGDAADCVELLVEVNGEREVVDAVLGAGGSGAGYENGGVAVLDEDCGVAELCHLADLHGEGAAFVHDLILLVIGELLLGDYHVFISFIFWRSRRLST